VGGVLVRAGKEGRRNIDASRIASTSSKTVLDGKSDKTVLSLPLSRNESPLPGNIRGDNEMSSLVFDDAISLNSYSTR